MTPALQRTNSWLLIGRIGGASSTRRQRRFRTLAAAQLTMEKWKLEGRATQWLYGPAESADGERPILIAPNKD